MRPIKVLQVNKLYYPEMGGIERTLRQLSEGLNACPNIDLDALVCRKKGRKRVEEISGVKVTRSGSLGVIASVPVSPTFIFDLRSMIQDRDIIQFHMPFPLGDLACLLSGYRGKVAAYWHSDVVKQKRWMVLYRPVMERFLRRADVILVGAQGIIEGSGYLKPYRDKCRIVPFAVSGRILEEGGTYLGLYGYKKKEKNLNFLFIGRLVYYKGCSVLLEAFSHLEADATLTLVGDGTLREELERRAEDFHISEKVRFMGAVSDEALRECMENADVFVLPSVEKSEAFGLVQLEAMAYGIPVINTRLPSGVPEVSVHGETGLTVSPGDAGELAAAMEWMSAHRKERERMGMAARRRVEENYTEKMMVERVRGIYEALCDS